MTQPLLENWAVCGGQAVPANNPYVADTEKDH